jgi:hypothetical protein
VNAPHPCCRLCAGTGIVRLPVDRRAIACPACDRHALEAPIADYSRGLRHGVLMGLIAGVALIGFALWIGILRGQA